MSTAYTNAGGIEPGDVINYGYTLKIQGASTLEDQSGPDGYESPVNTQRMVLGLYEGVQGMKVGERKVIQIPANKGFTDPGHPLYNEDIEYEVIINEIVSNVRDTDGDDSTAGEILRTLGFIILILGVLFVLFYIYQNRSTKRAFPDCAHCKRLGRKTRSVGRCSKCNNAYCAASFAKGCPNCRNPTLIPNN